MAVLAPLGASSPAQERPRARDLGVAPGVLAPGPLNAITDVAGVRVGQVTVWKGANIRSGATVILPHSGDVFREKVPAAVHVGNGFGKLTGVTQVRELGEIETPITLTCTLCVPNAANALIRHTLAQPGNGEVRSVNFVVGETNDGGLNDIRTRPVEEEDVLQALRDAKGGSVAEGAVGAGTGTVAFGWKGGIGTSSRHLLAQDGGFTLGVLVQSNFGGDLHILGIPVGRELERESREGGPPGAGAELGWKAPADPEPGSIMIVIATDAPLEAHSLERLARRAVLALGRTGSVMSNGSGDYVIAFSTAASVRRATSSAEARTTLRETVPNERLTPLFQAAVEATEEAIYNSLFRAVTVTGNGRTVEALPLERVIAILRRHDVIEKR
jgi:D-aminopeptidase